MEHSPDTSADIPRGLTPWLQEYDVEHLDPERHADLLIERVLAYGGRVEFAWLFRRYGEARVAGWVGAHGARRLPWRRYNLWCVLLELPRQERPRERQIWPH
jgi:hypothetical protein